MMSRWIATLALVAALLPLPVAAQSGCRFVLGFAELATMLGPDVVGSCVEDQRTITVDYQDEALPRVNTVLGAKRGDAVQRTTRGLMVWVKDSGSTMFLDGVGGFELASGPTRRYVWDANTQPAPPPARTDRQVADDYCASIYTSETIAAIDFTGTPSGQREAERRKAQADAMNYLCGQAAEQHGTRGVECFRSAWRNAAGMEQVFPGSGRQAYDDSYRACIAGR